MTDGRTNIKILSHIVINLMMFMCPVYPGVTSHQLSASLAGPSAWSSSNSTIQSPHSPSRRMDSVSHKKLNWTITILCVFYFNSTAPACVNATHFIIISWHAVIALSIQQTQAQQSQDLLGLAQIFHSRIMQFSCPITGTDCAPATYPSICQEVTVAELHRTIHSSWPGHSNRTLVV